jgi:hypothetical protein
MDHLPAPVLAIGRKVNVPYVCTTQFSYDHLGFLTFPDRVGVSHKQLVDTIHKQMSRSLEVIQAWLWFGLLGDTLSIGTQSDGTRTIADLSCFVDINADGSKWLTTRHLDKYTRIFERDYHLDTCKEFSRAKLIACISTAAEVLSDLLHNCDGLATNSPGFAILLGIQALFESLSFLFRMTYGTSSGNSQYHLSNVLVDKLLLEAGWSPSTINWLPQLISVRYFLSLARPEEFHALTSPPVVLGVSAAQSSTRHRTPDCGCKKASIEDLCIGKTVEKGRTMLWSFRQDESGVKKLANFSVSLTEIGDQSQYVAFSHVSAQGLGSTHSHSLPDCQLDFLQSIADEVLNYPTEPAKFWLDTLCIPIESVARKAALGSMNQIFGSASAVVVLDSRLMRASVGTAFDAMLRIRYSAWASRLWTLQEGAVSRRLYVKFANTTYDYEDLLASMGQQTVYETLPEYNHSIHNFPDKIYSRAEQLLRLNASQSLLQRASVSKCPDVRTKLRNTLLGLPMYRYLVNQWEKKSIDDALDMIESHIGA